MLTPRDIFPASRTAWFIVCRAPNATVYIRENGRRLADRFREHRKDVINGRNDLPVPAHFNQANHTLENMTVVVSKAGLANQEYLNEQEMRSIFKYGTMGPSGLNQDLNRLVVNYSLCANLRAGARYHVWHAGVCAMRHVSKFNELFNGI